MTLLLGAVRRGPDGRRPRPTPSTARSTASWTWRGVGPGTHVLEIGTGWGGLAIRAAQRGARVTTLTISAEQARLAEQRLAEAGVADRVAGAAARLPRGAGQLRRRRQRRDDRGGRRGATGRRTSPRSTGCSARAAGSGCRRSRCRTTGCWSSQRRLHLDPQVHLPRRADPVGARRSSRTCADAHRRCGSPSGAASARTTRARCALAASNFLARWETVAALGFDETFRRMWEFYLAYCEAGLPRRLPRRLPVLAAAPPLTRPARSDRPRSTVPARRPAARRARRAPPRRAAARPHPRVGRLRGRRRRTGPSSSSATGGRCGGCCGTRASWGWRGRSSRVSSTSRATSPRACPGSGSSRAPRTSAALRLVRRRQCSTPSGWRVRLGARGAAAEAARVGGPAVRRAAHPPPGPRRDRPPLRPVQRLLRVPARPADGLLLRLLDAGRRRRPTAWSTPSATSSTSICRKLGLKPGHAAARRRLRLGVAARARGDSTTACTAVGRHALGAAAGVRAWPGSRRSASRTGSRSGCRTTARSPDQPFDAVSSIEMGEHVGQDNYPVYAAQLHRLLLPHGRLLLQQMSRGAAGANTAPGGGAFMERYVAPDMHMRPLGETLNFLEAAGLEVVDVHSLREHYVWTVRPVAGHAAGQQGRGRRADRRGAVPGVAALPGGRGARVRGEPDGRAPDPHGAPRRRRAARACRAGARRRSGATRTRPLAADAPTAGRTARRAHARPSRHDDGDRYPWGAALTNLWVTARRRAGDCSRSRCSSPCGCAAAGTTASTWCGAPGFAIVALTTLVLALGHGRPVAAAADHGADLRVGAAARLAHRAPQPRASPRTPATSRS